MEILVDSLVAARRPDLVGESLGGQRIRVFDAYSNPWELRVLFEGSRPDVIMVDPAMIVISFQLLEIVRGAECRVDRVVVGADVITDVMKVQAMRGGFFDLVDISQPIDEIRRCLEARSLESGRRSTLGHGRQADRHRQSRPRPQRCDRCGNPGASGARFDER